MLFEEDAGPADLSSSLEAWEEHLSQDPAHRMEPYSLQFLTYQEAEVGLDELAPLFHHSICGDTKNNVLC